MWKLIGETTAWYFTIIVFAVHVLSIVIKSTPKIIAHIGILCYNFKVSIKGYKKHEHEN